MLRTLSAAAAVLFVVATTRDAPGQNITVQQPAFSNFQVQTTVSAPDGGGAMVGSTARSVRGGTTYNGLSPAGSRVGMASSGSSLQSRVTIHDLDEMDQQVLASAENRRKEPTEKKLNRRAELAWNHLDDLPTELSAKSTQSSKSRAGALPPADKPEVSGADSARLYREGVAAEAQGKKKLALAFFRTAAKQGSDEAKQELARRTRLRSETTPLARGDRQ